MNNTKIEELRAIAENFIKGGDFESGIFWLEKVNHLITPDLPSL